MEIIQNLKLKFKKNNYDSDEVVEYIVDLFDNEIDEDDFIKKNGLSCEIEEIYMTRDQIKEISKKISTEYKDMFFIIEGKEETTYESVEYIIEYNENKLAIKETEPFFERFPEDYDEYVDFCEEFEIEDILSEEDFEEKNSENDEWKFVQSEFATNKKLKFNNEVKI